MRVPFDLLRAAGQRYYDRSPEREQAKELIRQGRADEANDPEQVAARKARQAYQQGRAEMAAELAVAAAQPAAIVARAAERIIGRDNLVGVSYFERARFASRTVGRVVLRRRRGGQVAGYGTGFMVSPRLLLTNNHVLGSRDEARFSQIEFNYEEAVSGEGLTPLVFDLEPDLFFVTSPYEALDFALVAVAERAGDGTALQPFGWDRLIGQTGKAQKGEYLNIIQHPEGRPKQLALRDNLLVDMLELFLHYETDTLRGSSGSPVFNDDWEVVALHHSGVPRIENGQIIKIDGSPAGPTTPDSEIQWVANEGIRISRIVSDVQGRNGLSDAERRLRDELLDPSLRSPLEQLLPGLVLSAPPAVAPIGGTPIVTPAAGSVTFTIPLQVTVSLGGASQSLTTPVPGSGGQAPADAISPADLADAIPPQGGLVVEEVERPIEAYEGRAGYDRAFLGAGQDLAVPFPTLNAHQADAAPVTGAPPDSPNELRYTHFSVVMSKSRRMPRATAVNIDGRNLRNLPRGEDTWFFDPRIERRFQVGNELYRNNPLDRGHMVRRLDPVWGPGADVANDDTFHYTNACPQHANLNQRTWNDLEEYILGNAGAEDLKVTVFTGPVLGNDDPDYRQARLPREFWKVVAFVNGQTGQLAASAYLLSQAGMIHNLPEAFVFGAFRTFQVRVAEIEQKTGLSFGRLAQLDVLAGQEVAREALGGEMRKLIRGPRDLILR